MLLFRSAGARMVAPGGPEALLSGKVEDIVFRGDGFLIDLRLRDGQVFSFLVDRPLQVGEEAGLALPAGSLLALPEA